MQAGLHNHNRFKRGIALALCDSWHLSHGHLHGLTWRAMIVTSMGSFCHPSCTC